MVLVFAQQPHSLTSGSLTAALQVSDGEVLLCVQCHVAVRWYSAQAGGFVMQNGDKCVVVVVGDCIVWKQLVRLSHSLTRMFDADRAHARSPVVAVVR